MAIVPAFTYTLTNGTTADANQVMSNFNTLRTNVNANAAENGVNSSITQLTGLTTPLTVAQGGTGLGTLTSGSMVVGNGASAPTFFGPTSSAFRSFLAGLTLSNDGSTPNSVLDVSAGACIDSTNTTLITLAAFTKSTAGSWAAGTGGNGMGTGLTIAVSTWYHVFAIINAAAADVYFDTSVTAANAPAGTTVFRRIGSFKTDSSAHIIAFVQDGDLYEWKVPTGDISDSNPGTSAVLKTVNVPLGVVTTWLGSFQAGTTTPGTQVGAIVSDPATTDTAPSSTLRTTLSASGSQTGGQVQIHTNTSQQIRYRLSSSDAGTSVTGTGFGYSDSRGKHK